jgi:hypothetical protein
MYGVVVMPTSYALPQPPATSRRSAKIQICTTTQNRSDGYKFVISGKVRAGKSSAVSCAPTAPPKLPHTGGTASVRKHAAVAHRQRKSC